MVWEVKKFKSYIMSTHFKVVTDHNALKALMKKASLEGQLAFWADYLMGFDMDIVYCQGKDNVNSDTISRSMFN